MAKDIIVEKRVLIRMGLSSIGISLPLEWARRMNLKAGDEVAVIGNGILQIVPPSSAAFPDSLKEASPHA